MIIKLLLGLAVILIGAELFTNAVEWLGSRLGLSEGAVGSILAAVGTALPESIIPIVAILFSADKATSHIGIGAILGAPFMLGTLAFFITGLSARSFPWRGPRVAYLDVDWGIIFRDLIFFLIMYTLALGVSLLSNKLIHFATAGILVIMYFIYVYHTLKGGKQISGQDLRPLYSCFWTTPNLPIILLQVIFSLALIIWGAGYFVTGIKVLAAQIGVPSLVLALVIAPVATELPEKFNSIIWIAQKKDTLAMGNITGAMVFQSSLIPAIGLLFTPWQLNGTALLSGILVLCSIWIVVFNLGKNKRLSTGLLMFCGLFYLIFIAVIVWGVGLNV